MAILQAYQADVLKEMDEGAGLTPEAVKELRKATDLALRATKHTAHVVGWLGSRRAPPVAQPHGDSREGEGFFPFLKLGYLGRRLARWWRNFALLHHSRQFMPRWMRDSSNTPSTSLSRERSLPRKEPTSRSCTPDLDSVQMQARLAPARISRFNACLARFKLGHHVSVSTCRSVPCATYHSIQRILLRCFQHNTTNNKYFLSSKSDY